MIEILKRNIYSTHLVIDQFISHVLPQVKTVLNTNVHDGGTSLELKRIFAIRLINITNNNELKECTSQSHIIFIVILFILNPM